MGAMAGMFVMVGLMFVACAIEGLTRAASRDTKESERMEKKGTREGLIPAVIEALASLPQSSGGVMPCPACSGRLHWKRTYRRRELTCETRDCISVRVK